MRIGIDCSNVGGERTGVGQYAYNLVHSLSKIDKRNKYILYPFFYYIFHLDYKNTPLPGTGNFRVAFKNVPVSPQFLRNLWNNRLPYSFKEYLLGKVDVIHDTTFCAPRLRDKKKKLVVTVYDLTVLTHPQCHVQANIEHCLQGIKNAVKYADAIIAISHHTKNDLINYLNAPEDMIEVTLLAANPNYKPVTDDEVLNKVKQKYNLPLRYLLFLGSLEPRKNVQVLLHAYAKLPPSIRKDYYLVIAGARGWLNTAIPQIIQDLKITDRVHFTGYIDPDDICAVYSLATVFVYPSLYEGFGLPILEAMTCGTPVITSNTSSMPEVAGSAAMLVSPTDKDEIAEALKCVLEKEGVRNDMRAKGLKRAAEFSWEKCARETLQVYRKVGGF